MMTLSQPGLVRSHQGNSVRNWLLCPAEVLCHRLQQADSPIHVIGHEKKSSRLHNRCPTPPHIIAASSAARHPTERKMYAIRRVSRAQLNADEINLVSATVAEGACNKTASSKRKFMSTDLLNKLSTRDPDRGTAPFYQHQPSQSRKNNA